MLTFPSMIPNDVKVTSSPANTWRHYDWKEMLGLVTKKKHPVCFLKQVQESRNLNWGGSGDILGDKWSAPTPSSFLYLHPISHPPQDMLVWSICLELSWEEVPSHLTLRKWFQCMLVWILAGFCNCQFPYQSVCISMGRTWATSSPPLSSFVLVAAAGEGDYWQDCWTQQLVRSVRVSSKCLCWKQILVWIGSISWPVLEHRKVVYCVEILGAVQRRGHVKEIFWVKAFSSVYLKENVNQSCIFLQRKESPQSSLEIKKKHI